MHDEPALPSTCPNCGTTLPIDPNPRFCPACGQETRLHPPSFGEFVHEFVGHYVALEGALWRTLGALLFQPGRLTREYLDGRRRRYVPPLRLYLSASFLFFLVVKLLGLGGGVNLALQIDPPLEARPAIAVNAGEARELQDWIARCTVPGGCGWLEAHAAQGAQRLSGPEGARTVSQRMAGAAPYAMFLMLPAFAGLMHLAWRRSGLPYGAHFVFALHQHAFWFLMLLAIAAMPDGAGDWALLLMFAHAVVSMHGVYRASWPATIARALAVSLAYGLMLSAGSVVLAVAAVLMA